jgi:sterol desaturase/sphingolipid hydroxylase (fatty acid hydroxylase superfamily)
VEEPSYDVQVNATSTPLIVVAVFGLLFVLERVFPLRKATRSLLTRLLVNVGISAVTFVAAICLVQPAALWALRWSAGRAFGLVHLILLPPPLAFASSFILMDLSFYYWHLANHRIPLLWCFHNVHHIDPDLDVSTAFRFHFGEIMLSAIFTLFQVSLIGPSPWAFAAYQLAFQAEVLFHHSNIRLPVTLERLLNKVLVTPRMHGIHHSQVKRENNSNFGTLFPWWDRLHHTLGVNIPQDSIVVGIPGYTLPEDNTFRNALLMPFRKQRDYWRRPDGTPVIRRDTPEDHNPARLAE